jgi:carbon starvation protein
LGLWYHFAIMFEALFILTAIDAGTRVGRFLVQDFLGHLHPRLGATSWYPGVMLASAVVVSSWGYFLYQGVLDPLGGINTLWPLFGLANQLLAAIAFAVGTTILLKMGRKRYALVTFGPLVLVGTITFWAGLLKVASSDPHLGFWAHRSLLLAKLAAHALAPDAALQAPMLAQNDLVNATLASVFMAMTGLILLLSCKQWVWLLLGKTTPALAETPAEFRLEPVGIER